MIVCAPHAGVEDGRGIDRPLCQLCPIEVGRLSDPPMLRLWQELQEMKPNFDRRGSNNSFFPSSTNAGLVMTAG